MVLSGILLLPQEIQLWQTSLQLNEGEVQIFRALLSDDELARVERFKFDVHKRRFLVARGVLRTLLGQYLECDPRVIQFLYTQHGKPYLANTDLHFNISHSDEMAVYAFTRQAKIGVDIEKVEDVFKNDVAKRFFSHQEYQLLTALDGLEQQRGFYRIWSRKEALIKGVGEGLHIPLASFSVSLQKMEELKFPAENIWHLQSFSVDPAYEAAFASSPPPKKVSQFVFTS